MKTFLKILETKNDVPSKYVGKTLELTNGHPIVYRDGTVTDTTAYDSLLNGKWPLSVMHTPAVKTGQPLPSGGVSAGNYPESWFVRDLRYFAGTHIWKFEVTTTEE